MFRLAAILVSGALVLPAAAGPDVAHGADGRDMQVPETAFIATAPEPLTILDDARRLPEFNQVRIEQRVIIRISPSSTETRERMMADVPRRPMRESVQEADMGRCVRIDSIAAAHPTQDNRLLLFMHDRRVLTAALDRACSARDFYSGFYVERNQDGQLCSGRDRLQSRSGASCEVEAFHRLIAVRD
ncbi:hypothetical protein GRI97_08330 [Altererythrobacter xixiisoli]|uniref:Uncharacterized protein n=1 Tax=Croceibacterium xixiisoli TaxID=1476466 RepID=A0A6I4TXD4_9SPHN|nr:hypothetical protein [Croceibacterium xixiisoli]MXO98993.1 hypothetical protein [Croceibacterium xixiisoli]